MQHILVILTFSLAAGFLVKKFVWNPIFEGRQKKSTTVAVKIPFFSAWMIF